MELMETCGKRSPSKIHMFFVYFCVCRNMFMHPSYGVSPHALCRFWVLLFGIDLVLLLMFLYYC